jgi:hypothetical protein
LGRKTQETKDNVKILGKNPFKPNCKSPGSPKATREPSTRNGKIRNHPRNFAPRRPTPKKLVQSLLRGGKLQTLATFTNKLRQGSSTRKSRKFKCKTKQ